ncbi:hypothetical protein BJI69_20500 [Luteibacter rhizovicinus DSM 16549]|uniref:Uncharacterized protein n=1 Tax=Luteibacter rhizovicinus DSM 16549 TaxID=1440763 RepID=A0A0G9H2F7_9GAMM|nr:filamentous haemagglutinin family protein [Luteibacter rhizovicinus]APG06044.1 hypothetical protein BJI69_20500 [Luteibacter rhizovicinus DSM 16549]KLD63723.1 hypothetical protein Y883_18915 [Luteibacter rhizovicinus DSM 16549]KLD75298.1 hypothetical protein Y886_27850 [Xanthomonas hyacinthi DSM 19077]
MNKPRPIFRRNTLCQFIAMALFGGAAHAATPPPFSQAWLAAKQAGATQPTTPTPGNGAGNNGGNVFTPGNVMLQQRVQQSIANLDAAAQAVAAQMAAQNSAQKAAQQLASNVPDGIAAGGLKVDRNVLSDPTLWQNANAPTQSVANGQTTVEIKQNASKAIMTWESFNVGRHTTVHFDQTGGTQTDGSNQWIALNRINDPSGNPSTILGQIKAEGTVYLLNRNGMIFGGGAQVNTHSLIASSLDLFTRDVTKSNAFFMKYGIGATQDPEHILSNDGNVTAFLTSGSVENYAESTRGSVVVEKGASISGTKDGFVLLSAPTIAQAGQVVADDAQVILSAAPGIVAVTGATGNLNVALYSGFPSFTPPTGSIENTGLIQARRGSIHWLADDARQDGVVVASTSLSHPGSLVFDPANTQGGKITFGTGSVTTVLPEKDGETTSSSQDADNAFTSSSVKVNTPSAVMEAGSLMEVPAGNVTFNGNAYLAGGSIIDVSGLANVVLPMSALLVIVPRIGLNELADSPLLRNSPLYTAKNVAVDSTQSGTRADGLDWVGSPILNVAGYVANMPRTVDQLMINAGNITFNGGAIVRTGAQLRLEGGFLNYLPGYIQTPRLQGANGLMYDIASADPNVDYTGFAGVFTANHARWGVTETFTTSPLLANMGRFDPGFIKGGDAGTLTFQPKGGQDVVIDGDLDAHAYAGREQVRSGNLPLGGALDVILLDTSIASPTSAIAKTAVINYVIQTDRTPIESYVPDFNEDSAFPVPGGNPDDPNNPLRWRTLSTAMIENGGFRKLRLTTGGTVLVRDDTDLNLADGGEVDITAYGVDVEGKIVTHGGAINLISIPTGANAPSDTLAQAFLRVGSKGVLDTSGRWTNDAGRTADDIEGDAWIDGGSVSLTSWAGFIPRGLADDTANIYLDQGSLIDVSGGGYVAADGHLAMNGDLPVGRGGDVTLQTHVASGFFTYSGSGATPNDLLGGAIHLDGSIVAEGFSGGGTLTLHAPAIQVGGLEKAKDKLALLYLDPTWIESLGFSSYSLIADTDASVGPGVDLTLRPRYMLADQQDLLSLASTTGLLGRPDAAVAITTGDVGAFQRYTHRRNTDGLSIQAGIYQTWVRNAAVPSAALTGVTGTVDIGEGARLDVGSGNTLALSSSGHIVVDGSLVAHGGNITLTNTAVGSGIGESIVDRSLWLGADAVIDASGVSLIDPGAGALPGKGGLAAMSRTGTVLDGGSVVLSSSGEVVAEQGAQVLINGTNDTFDLPTDGRRIGLGGTSYAPSPVWSNGGKLTLQATRLFFDGRIDAWGGVGDSQGGGLTIVADPNAITRLGTPQIIIAQSGWRAPVGGDPYGPMLGQGDNGDLRFSADRLSGSGIDDLEIGTNGKETDVVFAGDVDLHVGRSIQIDSDHVASIGAGDRTATFGGTVAVGGHVTLSAPYVSIEGTYIPNVAGASSGSGSLDVNADFIDIGGHVNLSGFGNASFRSTGDLRFYLSGDEPLFQQTGWLFTTGNLDFTATRVYPTTGYRFLIDASNPASDTTVAFHQAGATDTTTPLSAGGSLAVGADHILQEGTIWVPSGAIALGTDDPAATLSVLGLSASMPLAAAKDVHLAPGSITSVSLDGAVVPYGTTEDGKDWHFESASDTGTNIIDKPPEKSVSIAGDNVSIDAGAKVDLSGGGHVQAVEWVPGTGGSRDVLSQYNTDFSNSATGTQVPQYADGRAIYAIVPGYHAPLSAHDASLEKGAGAGPEVGQGVYLSGVPGLPDGVYTLLPARYATLPGAFRLVQDAGVKDPVVGRVSTAPDGTQVVGGYFTDTLTGARDARSSAFMLQSAQTWGQYSEYTTTSADTFFADQAARNGEVAPRLGADAGRLTIAASKALTLGATLDAAPAAGGRGSQVDIAGDAIQILGGNETALDGYLHISADELTQLGAGSLLIGGKRDSTAQGDVVDVIADQVVLSNDAAHPLQGTEIILAASGNGGVTLGDGSVLRATASNDAASSPLLIGQDATASSPAINGDGALLRVSGLDPSAIVRNDITGIDGATGTPGGDLTIGAGAVIDAANSLSMDATGHTQLAADATLHAKAIDVTAGHIALGGSDTDAQADAGTLLIGPRVLAQLANSDSTTLRGRQSIDLLGDASLAASNDLILSTPTLISDGGSASLSAASVTFANDTGATSTGPAAGTGSLAVKAGAVHLGNGDIAASGLGHVDVNASSGLFASGTGTFDLGGADLKVTAPQVRADNGADNHLLTTGAMQLARGGQASAGSANAGGKLDLEAGSLDIGTDLVSQGGKFVLHATSGDVSIADGATIDVSGLSLPFNDTAVHVPGGTVQLHADRGNVTLAQGATVDVSGAADGGNAGTFDLAADRGVATLSGQLLGKAADGYLGGVLSVDTLGAFDLSDLSGRAGAGGFDGSVTVHTRQGDLGLAAGDTLHSHLVHLTADGGDVNIAGTVDASGSFGGTIDIFGAKGVDIDGRLDTSASSAGHHGGDITLGTSGVADGQLNATYGYEEIQAADAGHIRLGSQATLVQDGDLGDGTLYLRAPLLADGNVPVSIAAGIDLSRTSSTTLEAYAVWDAQDASTDLTKHFDGSIDAAGWFQYDAVTGKPTLVAGSFTDDAGNAIADPDRSNDAQVADYLSRYRFTPTGTNTDHATFYGYVNGDESQGAGTLMRFVQQPGIALDPGLAGVSNLHVRPGIELRNSGTTVNGGDISVLTNWNLGAGTQDANGVVHQVFRYGPGVEAPVLTLRADHDLDVRASVTDGFYQVGNAGGSVGGAPPDTTYEEASAGWQALLDTGNGVDGFPDLFSPPTDFSGDSQAIHDYYSEYVAYSNYLLSPLPGAPGFRPVEAITYGLGFGFVVSVPDAPAPLTKPTNINEYVPYLAAYPDYLNKSIALTDFSDTLSVPDVMQALAPPPTTLDAIDRNPPVDNSPSPQAGARNPLPLLSATLVGGNSSSYRFVAGADTLSVDPLALMGGSTGDVVLGGHTDYTDTATGRVIAAPTLIRTGTGDIDIAAAGDIRWTDDRAPAAIYTAGAPAEGTTADTSVQILQPSRVNALVTSATPELVVTGPVNPDQGGHVSLNAKGDILGLQNTTDTTGDLTGTAGTPTAQYWWQWMQTGNTEDRSSINFGAFDQGVMSVGGNVSIQAGGDIRELSVSLPTTWMIATDASGARSLRTIGGGDLSVNAGGDILSGSYFVAKGDGVIHADGSIGSDFSATYLTPTRTQATMPVSTLIAMQDAQVEVDANGSVSLGGIFNPSWVDYAGINALIPVGHADGQSYSSASRVDVTAFAGDLTYGDLASPLGLFAPGLSIDSVVATAGDILPATVSLIAANGDLNLKSAGELFPSSNGNLSLLAQDSVHFDMPITANPNSRYVWGLIDAPLSSLPSPLYLDPLTTDASSPAANARTRGYLADSLSNELADQQFLHASTPWHADDNDPVRVYALDGDIVNGSGGGVGGVYLMPSKVAQIEAGRDIVDLAYVGQQVHGSDISVIRAGRDIYDTPLTGSRFSAGGVDVPWSILPVIVQGGSGVLSIEAGRDLGRLASQTEYYSLDSSVRSLYKVLIQNGTPSILTGIDSSGNSLNPFLSSDGASIYASFGVGPGIDQVAFIKAYVDPSAVKPPGLDDGSASLVAFVEDYDAGLVVDTGLAVDDVKPTYSVAQAWARFQELPDEAKAIYTQKALFGILAQVGKDYNDDTSPFKGQYARGYAAINALFPASLGYTANGLGGGSNGAEQRVSTGDLDLRGSTIQTQHGGDISILGPGGEALLGGTSAPPPATDFGGNLLDGPNTQGILTLQKGGISMFTDGSTLLAQSRIFTEQGGDVTIWSSNGDINAGKGAKTTSEIPPVSYLCTLDAWCFENPAGQVSGAGIATLQTVPDAPEGSVYLMAPRGTVDAGDAGIRVSGNLVVAAAHVANADNVQVKGDSVGLPVVQGVNVGALNAASSAASAATKAAEDVARQQQSDARDRQPSIISVQVMGDNPSASVDTPRDNVYDASSPVQVVRRAGKAGDGLTAAERARMAQ